MLQIICIALERDLHLYKASLALANLIYAYSLMYTFTNLTLRMQICMYNLISNQQKLLKK